MTDIAFISDIHGNYPALRAVLSDIDSRGIKNIVCLGDLVGYYSMINEVIDTIKKREIKCIIGNHDFALLYNNGIIERSKTCTDILKKQKEFISTENQKYLTQLTQSVLVEHISTFYCVHGGLIDPIDEYLELVDESYFLKNNFEYQILATGHTHKLINKTIGKFTHINPGSVGQPRDGDWRSSYLVTNGINHKHIRVEYEVDEIVTDMKNRNFEDYIFKGLYTGEKIA